MMVKWKKMWNGVICLPICLEIKYLLGCLHICHCKKYYVFSYLNICLNWYTNPVVQPAPHHYHHYCEGFFIGEKLGKKEWACVCVNVCMRCVNNWLFRTLRTIALIETNFCFLWLDAQKCSFQDKMYIWIKGT